MPTGAGPLSGAISSTGITSARPGPSFTEDGFAFFVRRSFFLVFSSDFPAMSSSMPRSRLAEGRLDHEVAAGQLKRSVEFLDDVNFRFAGQAAQVPLVRLAVAIGPDAEDGRRHFAEPRHSFFVNEFAVLLISRGALDAALGANRPAMPLRLVDQPAKAVVVSARRFARATLIEEGACG